MIKNFNKTIPKLSTSLFLFAAALSIFIQSFSWLGSKAGAANATDRVNQVYILEWARKCYVYNGTSLSRFDVENKNPYIFSTTQQESKIGHTLDSDDGKWDCHSTDHNSRLFSALGLAGFDDFRAQFYKKDNDVYVFNQDRDFGGVINTQIAKLAVKDYEYYPAFQVAMLKCTNNKAPLTSNTDIPNDESYTVDNYIDLDGKNLGKRYFHIPNDSANISVGYTTPGDGDDDGSMECKTILSQIKKLGPAWADYKKTAAGQADSSSTGGNSGADNEPTCEGGAGSTGWIVCPLIDGSLNLLGKLEENIKGQLRVDLDNIVAPEGASGKVISDNTSSLREGNGSLTIFANAAFAIGVLWIVVSQAITGGAGGGFFGAYEAKKVLPKLIAGVIAANFSWDLVNIMLKVSNSLGDATKSIMLAPFSGISNGGVIEVGGWDGLLITGAGLGAVALAFFGFFAISPILIAAVVSIVVGYFALIFRKALIIGLVTFAPIALVISPFAPNITKKWFNLLRNMIFMYPIIMAMISIFSIMGYILNLSADAASNSLAGAVLKLAAIASFFAPYFMIVMLFKLMGDILGKIAGSVQAVGDKAGKSFGQKRLEGNSHRVKRDLLKNARKNQKHKSSYRDLVNTAQYSGRNPYKNFKRRYLEERQADGSILTPGGRKKRRETKRSNQYELTAQDEKLSMEAGQAAISAESVSSFDPGRDYTVIDPRTGKKSNVRLGNKMDLQRMLAEGHTVEYSDVAGRSHRLSGEDQDVRFAAAMALGQAGDVSQVRKMMSSVDPDTRKLAKIAVASNEAAFVGKAPDLTSKPNKIAFSDGMTYNDVSGWHGSTVDEAVKFQSQTYNFLSDEHLSKYNEAYEEAFKSHGDAAAAHSAAQLAVGSEDPNAWSEAEGSQRNAQTALNRIMKDMANDPRRTDTKNQDKINRYQNATGTIL